MSKTKKPPKSRDVYPKLPAQSTPPVQHESHAFRETVESIVIAFVLAFLFRTFEAEAFVIPTGSMAPTLMGAHKDVDCLKCGHRFRVNSSEEDGDEMMAMRARLRQPGLNMMQQEQLRHDIASTTCLAGMCPNCRYVSPMRAGLPIDAAEREDEGEVQTQKRYNGDRILVNKYIYTVNDPERWDVVVFKFPGNAQMNYIKRLVGLPNETVRVFQGDLFIAPNDGTADPDFAIARKPEDRLLAMRQLVHDTDYDPAELYAAGWPLRWQGSGDASGWKVSAESDELTVRQRFEVDAADGRTEWLRYRHLVPSYDEWREVEDFTIAAANGPPDTPSIGEEARPQLVTDFNAYNTRVSMASIERNRDLRVEAHKLGLHWVGDLMVEADVDVQDARGELLVDLVEAGRHFTATVDLSTGRATGIQGYHGIRRGCGLRRPRPYHPANQRHRSGRPGASWHRRSWHQIVGHAPPGVARHLLCGRQLGAHADA
jgi:signal peptidase I